METLVKAILVISPWLLSVLVVVPIVVSLLLVTSSSTLVASVVELVASSVVELVLIVVTMVVLVIKPEIEIEVTSERKIPAMILVMAMISSLANIVVPLTHLPLLHVVVVSLLRHFHVVISLVLRVHVVVPLVHLLLLLHHLGALTELWRWLVEIVRMLQLVNRRRLMLNVVAELVTRWRLLHLPLLLLLLPLLRLVLDVRMLGLVAALVVEWHRTSVPHPRVAEDTGLKINRCTNQIIPQIMHGRVEMAQGSTSIALLLDRNRGVASMTMWRGRWSSWRHCRS